LFGRVNKRRSFASSNLEVALVAVPALEIGGTHVAGAMVDLEMPTVVVGTRTRAPLDADGASDSILASILSCARSLGAPGGSTWGVAIPGPFDYASGIGGFEGVAKFGSLRGVDVGQRLLDGLPTARRIVFLNDADAFLIGEWAAGAAVGHDRVAGITLGTGIGSAFLAGGRIVSSGPDVPPHGEVHLLSIDGRPLEDIVSRRAIVATYARLAGPNGRGATPDVAEIAARARGGEASAQAAIEGPVRSLGRALSPWLARFGATAVVVGGSMTGSWDLVEPPLREGLGLPIELVRASLPDDAGLIGAALHAADPMQAALTRHTATQDR
jgi:glucokinase